jgi:hypothetical protein
MISVPNFFPSIALNFSIDFIGNPFNLADTSSNSSGLKQMTLPLI